jgi:hypothetical protein
MARPAWNSTISTLACAGVTLTHEDLASIGRRLDERGIFHETLGAPARLHTADPQGVPIVVQRGGA